MGLADRDEDGLSAGAGLGAGSVIVMFGPEAMRHRAGAKGSASRGGFGLLAHGKRDDGRRARSSSGTREHVGRAEAMAE